MCIEMEGGDFDFGWHSFPVFLLERKEGKDHLQLDYLRSPKDKTNETIEESWTKEQEKESNWKRL